MSLSWKRCIYRSLTVGIVVIIFSFSFPWEYQQQQHIRSRTYSLEQQPKYGQELVRQDTNYKQNLDPIPTSTYTRDLITRQRQSHSNYRVTITDMDSALTHHNDPPKPRNVSIPDNNVPISELQTKRGHRAKKTCH
jgi:hypothetical protein